MTFICSESSAEFVMCHYPYPLKIHYELGANIKIRENKTLFMYLQSAYQGFGKANSLISAIKTSILSQIRTN